MLVEKKLQPSEAFGLALRHARKAAGKSQEQLGLDADVQRNFISLIERGINQPSINTIFKLAQSLDLKPSELVAAAEAQLTVPSK